jgi:hypothetical protein
MATLRRSAPLSGDPGQQLGTARAVVGDDGGDRCPGRRVGDFYLMSVAMGVHPYYGSTTSANMGTRPDFMTTSARPKWDQSPSGTSVTDHASATDIRLLTRPTGAPCRRWQPRRTSQDQATPRRPELRGHTELLAPSLKYSHPGARNDHSQMPCSATEGAV